MTLIRFVQRASILAGITFAGVAFHGGSATAENEKFCVVANNGKTACGTLKAVERACVSTDNGVVCGKFKSVAAEQGQEATKPVSGNAPRIVVNNIVVVSKGCSKSDTTVKCNFSIRNKSAEKQLSIYAGNSKMTDSSGKTHIGSSIEMGGQTTRGFNNSMTMTPDIDYDVNITFDNVPAGVTKTQVVSFYLDGKAANFRNIIISD